MSNPTGPSPFDCAKITAWQSASVPPPLSEVELHLWKIDDPDRPQPNIDLHALSVSEQERALAFRHVGARDTYIHSRWAMRRILGGYLGIDPALVRFTQGPHGKPYLDHPGSMLQFNLTHSGRLCLLAVMRELEVGLDTEQIRVRRNMETIAARMFDAERVRLLTSLPPEQRAPHFYLYWTWMEAAVKARGGGLFDGCSRERQDLHQICFIPHPGFQGCVAVDGPCPPLGEWRTLLFRPSS